MRYAVVLIKDPLNGFESYEFLMGQHDVRLQYESTYNRLTKIADALMPDHLHMRSSILL